MIDKTGGVEQLWWRKVLAWLVAVAIFLIGANVMVRAGVDTLMMIEVRAGRAYSVGVVVMETLLVMVVSAAVLVALWKGARNFYDGLMKADDEQ